MGLNRMMMMGKGEVKVVDGSKFWAYNETDSKTIAFTVPPGIKRIKVEATMDDYEGSPDEYIIASISNTITKKFWGKGESETNSEGDIEYHFDIDEVVGVTSNKTYTLLFSCWDTSGVTFSWGKAINDMTPTVEDY